MSLRDLKLKPCYNSDEDDILNGFYIPALSNSIKYNRIAGFFSSNSFAIAAKGIAKFIINGGRIKLISNVVLSLQDYRTIVRTVRESDIDKFEKECIRKAEEDFINDINKLEEGLKKDHLKMLSWLLKTGKLELKIAVVTNGIQHQKTGILEDEGGNVLSFTGSDNETQKGWLDHTEKFHVFCGWKDGDIFHLESDIEDFNKFWDDKGIKTRVYSASEAFKKNFVKIAPRNFDEFKYLAETSTTKLIETEKEIIHKEQEIILRDYQKEAIDAWFKNNMKGIFEMATGTGKTYTAIEALTSIIEKEKQLIIVISCPFLHLLPQWEKCLSDFKIDIPRIYASSNDLKWREKLTGRILDIKLKRLDKIIILTTHDTFSSENFRYIMKDITYPVFIIGDEVHGMGSTNRLSGFLSSYRFRLGLSATPRRYFDDEGTEEIFSFFGDTVYKFDLHRAINEINPMTGESFLTPYEYYPIFINLSVSEFDEYVKISKIISRLFAMKKKTKKDEYILEKKLRDRQDILKNAENKYEGIRQLLKKMKNENEIKHTLIYCSHKQINRVQDIVRNEGKIIQHRFTSNENATKIRQKYGGLTEREYILNNFDNGLYDILIAIRCLDEGVDVPSTRTAILMSSSGNPKEYIQRRGRILRRFSGKEKAILYDFIAIPDISVAGIDSKYERKAVESQFKRIEEFVKESLNKSEISRNLFKIRLKYQILE